MGAFGRGPRVPPASRRSEGLSLRQEFEKANDESGGNRDDAKAHAPKVAIKLLELVGLSGHQPGKIEHRPGPERCRIEHRPGPERCRIEH